MHGIVIARYNPFFDDKRDDVTFKTRLRNFVDQSIVGALEYLDVDNSGTNSVNNSCNDMPIL